MYSQLNESAQWCHTKPTSVRNKPGCIKTEFFEYCGCIRSRRASPFRKFLEDLASCWVYLALYSSGLLGHVCAAMPSMSFTRNVELPGFQFAGEMVFAVLASNSHSGAGLWFRTCLWAASIDKQLERQMTYTQSLDVFRFKNAKMQLLAQGE